MRYYAKYNESNKLVAIGTGSGGVEISETEYNELLTIIREKVSLVNDLYTGKIAVNSIREDWREEIQRRVEERKVWEEENAEEAELTEADYLAALAELGVSVNEEN